MFFLALKYNKNKVHKGENMDVKRVEGVAIPTAIAAVAAGTAGYVIPKAVTKNGEMSDMFVKYVAGGLNASDIKLMKEADSLDKINPFITDEEVLKLKGDRNRVLDYAARKLKKANAALEKFATKHADALGIKPKEGQKLSDAVKAYLVGKDAAAVKEDFLPSSTRRILESQTYIDEVQDAFGEVYDSAAKKFKSGEGIDETVKFFKKAARNMKLTVGGAWALAGGGIALASTIIADRISHRS